MVRIWKKYDGSCCRTCWIVRTTATATIRSPARFANCVLPKLRKVAGVRARAPIKCFPLPRSHNDKEGALPPPPYFFRLTESGLLLELSDERPCPALDLLQLQRRVRGVAVGVERVGACQALEAGGLGDRGDDLSTGRRIAVVGVDRAADRVNQDGGAVVSGVRVGADVGRSGVRRRVGRHDGGGGGVLGGVRH